MSAPAQISPSERVSTLDRVAALAARLLGTPAAALFIGERPKLHLRGQAHNGGREEQALFDDMRALALSVPVSRSHPVLRENVQSDPILSQAAESVRFCAAFAVPLWDGSTFGILIAAGMQAQRVTPNQIRDM